MVHTLQHIYTNHVPHSHISRRDEISNSIQSVRHFKRTNLFPLLFCCEYRQYNSITPAPRTDVRECVPFEKHLIHDESRVQFVPKPENLVNTMHTPNPI